jgi:hypothetical protein
MAMSAIMNIVESVVRWEQGDMPEDELVHFVQDLIDTDMLHYVAEHLNPNIERVGGMLLHQGRIKPRYAH